MRVLFSSIRLTISPVVESSLIFLLRGLISNLSVQTKFYSSPRRPLPIAF